MNEPQNDARLAAIPDVHGHAKGEHKPFAEERPIALSARMLFLWFYHACRRGAPRFLMVADHMNYLTFEDPAAVNLVRRALKLAQAGDLYGAAETASVEVGHAAVVSEGLRRGMRYSIGAEVDNDPRSRPDAQNIVDAMKPDGMIRSIHFLQIDHPTLGQNWNWPFDNPEFAEHYETLGTERVWELYMAALLDAVERLPGNIVGHFYVPAKFGHWPSDENLERYEDQLIEAAARREMAVELNTRFFYRSDDVAQRELYRRANLRLLRKAKAAGVGIAVGSDAHSPKDQGRAFEEVLALLDEAEVNELVFPIGGRLLRVALRVVREQRPEPQPEPAVEAADANAGERVEAPDREAGEAHAAAAAEAPARRRPAKKAAATATESPETAARAAEEPAASAGPDAAAPPATVPGKRPVPPAAEPLAERPAPAEAAAARKAPAAAKAPAAKVPGTATPAAAAQEPAAAGMPDASPASTSAAPPPRSRPPAKAPASRGKAADEARGREATPPARRTPRTRPAASRKRPAAAVKSSGSAKAGRATAGAKKTAAKAKPAAKAKSAAKAAPKKSAAAKKARASRPSPSHKIVKAAKKSPAKAAAAKRTTQSGKKTAAKKAPAKKSAAKRHR